MTGYGTFEKAPKTENGIRTITISKTVSAILRQYKGKQIQDRFILGDAWKNDNHVFVHEDGTDMHPHRPYKWFTEFLERHGLPKITFHQLRHTNASLLIGQGVDVATIAKRLGHADKSVTLRTYAHALKEHDREAADKLDNLLNNKKD